MTALWSTKERVDTSLVHTSAKQFVATTSQYGLLFELGSYYESVPASFRQQQTDGGLQRTRPHRLSPSAVIIKETFWGFFIKTRVQRGQHRSVTSISLWLFWTPGTCFSLLRAEAQVWKGDKVLIVPFLPSFSTEVGGHWSETTCLSRCLPGYSLPPGSLPTSLRWLIKVLHHQTLTLAHDSPAPRWSA